MTTVDKKLHGNQRLWAYMNQKVLAVLITGLGIVCSASAFEGRIAATITQGGITETLLYTAGTNFLRIERKETDQPYPCDIVDLASDQMTLLYPHLRSFIRFSVSSQSNDTSPGLPQMPSATPGAMAPGVGPTGVPGAPSPGMGMPMMPRVSATHLELKDMGETMKLLGYSCEHYQIVQPNETMDVWATDQLLPFQAYLRSQPFRRGPVVIEQQWGQLLKDKKMFPLRAVLTLQGGREFFQFNISEINPEKIEDKDGSLSQVPAGYNEVQPFQFSML
jgi:hypothetical protein